MLNLENTGPASLRRRSPSLPPMRLGRFAQAGLIGLRLLLGFTAGMAAYAVFHPPG